MSDVTWRKRVNCKNNGDFIFIQAYSGHGLYMADPKADEYLLTIDSTNEEIGQTVLNSLFQSRELSILDARALNLDCQKNYEAWVEKLKKIYGYKTKKALFKNMMSCGIELSNGMITISPTHHEKLEGWGDGDGRITAEDDVVISEKSTPAEIGAALRLAFSRCTTKGF